jgi:hypothetical protein
LPRIILYAYDLFYAKNHNTRLTPRVNVLGIDPGKNGGFAILTNGHITAGEAMPVVDGQLNFLQLVARLKKYGLSYDHVFVERVRNIAGTSSKSNFMFGRNYQVALCAADLSGKPISLVDPLAWQRISFEGVQEIYKVKGGKNKRDTKAMALVKVKRMWPHHDFTKNARSRVPHDGIVDAALIAYYGYLKLTKQLPYQAKK